MSKNCKKHKTDSISPCSNNYNEKVKNKAIAKNSREGE